MRNLSRSRRIFLASLVIALLFDLEASVGPASASSEGGFVARSGTELLLNGKPYRFTGINVYNANSVNNNCWYSMGNNALLDDSLSNIDASSGGNAKVLRAWFFQRLATVNGERDWSAFDHTLAVAKQHGWKVIAVLANQWGDCEQPDGYKTESWYQSGYKQVDPSGNESYRAWVQEVVHHYRGNPTIAMWMLMNEAEDAVSAGGTCTATATQTLRHFADDMGTLVKRADPNHLLALGTMGNGQCGASSGQYQTVYASPNIDVCEYHDYNAPYSPMPGDRYNGLQVRINQCKALNKPIIVGESGIDPSQVGGLASRAALYDQKIATEFGAGIAGYLAWDWEAAGGSGGDQYVVGPGDPTLAVLGKY